MAKRKQDITIHSSAAEYLTFVASTGDNVESIEMRYEDEKIWLTQKMMAALYGVSVSAINQHLKTIFSDSELDEQAVIKKYLITASDGKRYNTNHYSLQTIIAVGFKVDNERAVQFRKWANTIVKDYTIKDRVMDKERLKNGGSVLTEKYFEEQLEDICGIRLSKRKFYQKITESMRPPLTMIERRKPQRSSLPRSRIKCTLLSMVIPRLKLSTREHMRTGRIWG